MASFVFKALVSSLNEVTGIQINYLSTVKTTPKGLQTPGVGNLTQKAHLLRMTWDVQVHSIAHSVLTQKMELELPG